MESLRCSSASFISQKEDLLRQMRPWPFPWSPQSILWHARIESACHLPDGSTLRTRRVCCIASPQRARSQRCVVANNETQALVQPVRCSQGSTGTPAIVRRIALANLVFGALLDASRAVQLTSYNRGKEFRRGNSQSVNDIPDVFSNMGVGTLADVGIAQRRHGKFNSGGWSWKRAFGDARTNCQSRRGAPAQSP